MTMAETPTPGQQCYEAYTAAYRQRYAGPPLAPWQDLLPDLWACWEAAAQAVRAPQDADGCAWCGEPLPAGDGRPRNPAVPPDLHWECAMRLTLGSRAHVERRCGCYVPGAREGDDPTLTRHEAAWQAVEAYERRSHA